jgi:hypothetical protein
MEGVGRASQCLHWLHETKSHVYLAAFTERCVSLCFMQMLVHELYIIVYVVEAKSKTLRLRFGCC